MQACLSSDYVPVHMTGTQYGTLNYYSITHENMPATINGDTARLKGQSVVDAKVYGSRGTRHLQSDCSLRKENGRWMIIESVASTY